MNQDPSTSSLSSTAGAENVSRRAYELWEKEGRPEGCDLRHWLQAEQECRGNQAGESSNPERAANTSESSAPSVGSDVRPLQGTRAAAASSREPKRATNSPFSGDRAPGNGQIQSSGKRRSPSTPAL
jgi:hypothetical protein